MAKELLKEAIADAKAVREVALQNAKMALEEAFDSKIKNMLSAKLAEEIEEDVELEEEYVEEEVETTDEAVETTDEGYYEEDDKDEANEEVELEEDIDEEINLDELMAELEEMSDTYEEDEDGMQEDKDIELEESDETLDELVGSYNPAALDFGTGMGILAATAIGLPLTAFLMMKKEDKKEFLNTIKANAQEFKAAAKLGGQQAIRKMKELGEKFGLTKFIQGAQNDNVSESFDIDALIAEIEAELEEGKANDDKVKKAKKKDDKEKQQMEEELAEALSTVTALQETISEMNLLNSKLLYCNKLFRANSLNESQKVKVVDALDKATTTGEAKLVFETLQESFAFTGVEKRAIKEGLGRASKPAGVAPKKVLSESVDETVSRFQKLANINK